MILQDILPITSMTLIIVGVLIILGGVIWLANTITNEEVHSNIPSTEDIIGEMNHMFTYFTDQIHQKDNNIVKEESTTQEMYILQSKYYSDVIKYKQQGKTPDQIAQQLNIGKGEVNLILGLAQMR